MKLDNLSTQEQKHLEKILSKTRKEKRSSESEEVRLTVIPETKTKTESQLKNERRIKKLENSVTTLAEVMTDLVEQADPNKQGKIREQESSEEKESDKLEGLDSQELEVYQVLTDEYKSSTEIAEETGLSVDQVKLVYNKLKEKDLAETALAKGIRIKQDQQEKEEQEEEAEEETNLIKCKLCGEKIGVKGFGRHLKQTEGIDIKSYFETEQGTYKSEKYGVEREGWKMLKTALNKHPEYDGVSKIAADNLLEIKENQKQKEEEVEQELSQNEEFEKIIDDLPDSEVDRIDLLRQLSTNFSKTMNEIAEESGQPEANSAYYMKTFKEYDLIIMKRNSGSRLTDKGRDFLQYVDSKQESAKTESKSSDEEKSFREERQSGLEELLADTNITDRDFQIATLAFEKIINREDNDFVSYHLFEQNFEGDNIKPMRFFQKMFSNPEMVQHLLDSIGEERDWTWSKKQDFKDGMKNWVIKLK